MSNLLRSVFIFILLLSGCGYNGTPTRSPQGIVPLTSITIVPVYSKIAMGTSTTLTAIGSYAGVPGDVTDLVDWSSASEGVAIFYNKTGPNKNRVNGIVAGTAVITATVGSVSATYTLTVTNATVTALTISTVPPSTTTPTVHAGLTKQFATTGTFSDLTTQDLTFDATWSADSSGYASFDDLTRKGLATGHAVGTTHSVGTATITASFGTATPASTDLIVTAPLLQSITVSGLADTIYSKTVTFIATGTYSDGPNATISAATWDSSNKSVATITSGGVATPVAAGTTTISATMVNADGVSIVGNIKLTVTAFTLNLTPTSLALVLGSSNTGQFTLTATPTGGTALDVTSSSAWSSSNTNVASVNATTGLVTAVSAGTTIITVTYGGQSLTATVTVN